MANAAAVHALARELGAEVRETHGAWVLLHDRSALKLKKPVRFSFMDYSTPERRRAACEAEVEVNDALAPGVYLGVGDVRLGDEVEAAVRMRRFDEADTLASVLERGELDAGRLEPVARLIAAFHAGQPVCRTSGAGAAFEERAAADFADLAELLEPGAVDALRRCGAALVARHGATLEARGAGGLVRDGHGDLRAEHVLLEDRVRIVDRIEFAPELRCVDVADDLAFLEMDLERLGARWAADALAEAYERAGGDGGDPRLRALYAWRRALVRAKVALLRGQEPEGRALLALAGAFAWRARGPLVVAVCGPPASGKSTLARAIARRLEVPLVSSDELRKRLLGLASTDRAPAEAYTEEVTARVYAELASEGSRAIEAAGGVVLDATFGRAPMRAAVSALRPLWLRLGAPVEVLRERATARLADPERISDAEAAVATALAEGFEALDDIAPADVCGLDARRTAEELVDDVAAWLDARAA